MVVVPAVTPVTIPVSDPMVATDGEPLVHVPPGVALVSVIVFPWHTLVGPAMATGGARTVKVTEPIQPSGVM